MARASPGDFLLRDSMMSRIAEFLVPGVCRPDARATCGDALRSRSHSPRECKKGRLSGRPCRSQVVRVKGLEPS